MYTASLANSPSKCVNKLVKKYGSYKTRSRNTKQQLTMGKIRQVPSTVPSAVGALGAMVSRRFTTKLYTRDEEGGKEDAFAGCIWRGMTTSSKTQTSMTVGRHTKHPRWNVVSSYFAHVLTCRGVYSRAAFISLSASNCVAFIQGRRLFAEIR